MNRLSPRRDEPRRQLRLLALTNASIWVIAMIAMIILIQDAPAVKKLAPILMAGVGAGVALLATISRVKG